MFGLPKSIKLLSNLDTTLNVVILGSTAGNGERKFRFEYGTERDVLQRRERLGSSVSLRGVCCVEGCLNNDVEIHHLKKVKDNVEIVSGIIGLKGIIMKSGYDPLRDTLWRKQLSLCRKHHGAMHKGELDISDL